MSEITSISAGSTNLTNQNTEASQSASVSSVQASQSVSYSSVEMTSQSVGLSNSSSDVLSDHNAKMMALIMALIDMIFGNDDEDSTENGLMALLAASAGGSSQSTSYTSYTSYSQSSVSISEYASSSSVSMEQGSVDASQTGSKIDVSA